MADLETRTEPCLSPNYQSEWPFVSVVVPVYNGEYYLPALLQSLAQLDYPKERLEILLVNNNSTDGTAALLASSPFNVIFEPRPGAGAARNAGIRQAQGEFIAFTDADCIVHPQWIKDLLPSFQDSTIGAVAGTIQPYTLTHPIERYEALCLNSPGHRAQHVFLPTASTTNVMYRADVFQKIGLFIDRTYTEETDLNWRMQTQTDYHIYFLQSGGLVWHRYRANLKKFCQVQRNKAGTVIDLHQRWNLRAPTGRKELFRAVTATMRFVPITIVRSIALGPDLIQTPKQVLHNILWQSWLDILVPWNRFRGIRQAWRSSPELELTMNAGKNR